MGLLAISLYEDYFSQTDRERNREWEAKKGTEAATGIVDLTA